MRGNEGYKDVGMTTEPALKYLQTMVGIKININQLSQYVCNKVDAEPKRQAAFV